MTRYERDDEGHLTKLKEVSVGGGKTVRVWIHSARCPAPGCVRVRRIAKDVVGDLNIILGGAKR